MSVKEYMDTNPKPRHERTPSQERSWAATVIRAVNRGWMTRGGEHHRKALDVLAGKRPVMTPAQSRRWIDRSTSQVLEN